MGRPVLVLVSPVRAPALHRCVVRAVSVRLLVPIRAREGVDLTVRLGRYMALSEGRLAEKIGPEFGVRNGQA